MKINETHLVKIGDAAKMHIMHQNETYKKVYIGVFF